MVEVLGIKERSLSHLEQLTEQLEQKNQVINCLKQQLATGSSDLLYRVRQQVDWFTENISQQCSKGNCSEEVISLTMDKTIHFIPRLYDCFRIKKYCSEIGLTSAPYGKLQTAAL